MSDTIIKAENLSKVYYLGELHRQANSFREKVTEAVKRLMTGAKHKTHSSMGSAPNSIQPSQEDDHIWALKDVSFDVKKGEVLGIVGRNGAGKSTLLKILSRITKPTCGIAWINGSIGSLLEVGTGFHQELTGRENIYLNGAVLGMRRSEITKKFDEIVSFAETEKFIETPVKRYSSGMYLRLAFAVAAHLETDILLVDEVLAVGDAEFQKKCLGKMDEVTKKGRTVLFVSHNMGAISSLTSRSILLDKGRIKKIGPTNQVIDKYFASSCAANAIWEASHNNNNPMQILNVRMYSSNDRNSTSEFDVNNEIYMEIKYVVRRPVRSAIVAINIHAFDGAHLVSLEDADSNKELLSKRYPGFFCTTVKLPSTWLNSGSYLLRVGCGIPRVEVYDNFEALTFTIVETGDPVTRGHRRGYLLPMLKWETDLIERDI